jgi:multiple sugar transport system permease protein
MRIFYSIVLPVAAPGLFSAGVLSFLGSWGEFMHAFTVSLGIRELQTVPVAVLSYSQAFELQWTWISAATVLAIIPVVALVAIFQRFVISGLTGGAIEG